MSPVVHTKPQVYWPFGSGEDFYCFFFYRVWSWRPSWSCDPDAVNKLSSSPLTKASYEIWPWMAYWFLRKRRLKSMDVGRRTTKTDGQTDDGAWLYYKLKYGAKGSGKLMIINNNNTLYRKSNPWEPELLSWALFYHILIRKWWHPKKHVNPTNPAFQQWYQNIFKFDFYIFISGICCMNLLKSN